MSVIGVSSCDGHVRLNPSAVAMVSLHCIQDFAVEKKEQRQFDVIGSARQPCCVGDTTCTQSVRLSGTSRRLDVCTPCIY
jgi:hypothetical protein